MSLIGTPKKKGAYSMSLMGTPKKKGGIFYEPNGDSQKKGPLIFGKPHMEFAESRQGRQQPHPWSSGWAPSYFKVSFKASLKLHMSHGQKFFMRGLYRN